MQSTETSLALSFICIHKTYWLLSFFPTHWLLFEVFCEILFSVISCQAAIRRSKLLYHSSVVRKCWYEPSGQETDSQIVTWLKYKGWFWLVFCLFACAFFFYFGLGCFCFVFFFFLNQIGIKSTCSNLLHYTTGCFVCLKFMIIWYWVPRNWILHNLLQDLPTASTFEKTALSII